MCVDGGSRKPHHVAAALLALPLDVLIAHTVWALVAGWPKHNEWTISDTLERLCVDIKNPDWGLFIGIAKRINRESPTKNHIRSVSM
jgi:hypothetical protein